MGEILILDRVVEELISNNHEYILFGERNYVKIGEHPHDFIFHFIPRISFERLHEDSLLVVPVLHYENPNDYDEAVNVIGEIHKANPSLAVFCIRDADKKTFTRRGRTKGLQERTLKFFDVCDAELGTEVTSKTGYSITSEKELGNTFGSWAEDSKRFSALKKELFDKYVVS